MENKTIAKAACYPWRPANAEVDFVISRGTRIIPIEVKSGTTGTLKSLHQFMVEKQSNLGVRFNMDLPSLSRAQGKTSTGREYDYPLLSLPCYLVERVIQHIDQIKSVAID